MTSDFSYAACEDAGVKTKSSKKIEKGLKRLLIIALIILIAQIIWLFGISSFIPFSVIEVHGFESLSRAEIIKIAGLNEKSSFVSVNIKEIQDKLSGYVLIESAKITKRFPDKLSIFLVPRQEAAAALTNTLSGQRLIYVDKKGVFFKITDFESVSYKVPVISGIDNPQLGMRLPSGLLPLIESISVIAEKSPDLLAAISEIRVERKAWDGFELILYPVHSPIRVRIENNLTEDVIRYMLLMLNVFESESQKPQEIDFRSGMGSYKLKEQYDGR
ncbi:MAG: FtsQ-type POTRA domain-containing protein [Treponema sp.]|nr:FtsQ-type POTRA domain-containing protein [Treponema sp.]